MSKSSFLSDEQVDAITEFTTYGCKILCLGHWTIDLDRDPEQYPTAWASIRDVSGKNHSFLSVCHDFPNLTNIQISESLWHELLHLSFRPLRRTMIPLEDLLGKLAWSVFFEIYDNQEELLVDFLSYRLSEDHNEHTEDIVKRIMSPAATPTPEETKPP